MCDAMKDGFIFTGAVIASIILVAVFAALLIAVAGNVKTENLIEMHQAGISVSVSECP